MRTDHKEEEKRALLSMSAVGAVKSKPSAPDPKLQTLIEHVGLLSGQVLRGKRLSGGECEEERLARPLCVQDVCDTQVDGEAPAL
jgi:hypothetical protein